MRIKEIKKELEKKQKILDVMKKIVDIVEPLDPHERLRAIKAAAILSGMDLER